MTDLNKMSNAELVEFYNSHAAPSVKPVKKFRTLAEGVKRCEKLNNNGPKLEETKATRLFEKAAKKKKERKPWGHDILVAEFGPNVRRPGSNVHRGFDQAAAYHKAHPNCSMADIIQNSSYRRIDFRWDHPRGNIRIK